MKFNGIDIKLNEILSKGDKTIMTAISGWSFGLVLSSFGYIASDSYVVFISVNVRFL